MNQQKNTLHRPQQTQKIPPNVGETHKTLQFLQDCPAESTVQHLATDGKDTAS